MGLITWKLVRLFLTPSQLAVVPAWNLDPTPLVHPATAGRVATFSVLVAPASLPSFRDTLREDPPLYASLAKEISPLTFEWRTATNSL